MTTLLCVLATIMVLRILPLVQRRLAIRRAERAIYDSGKPLSYLLVFALREKYRDDDEYLAALQEHTQ